MLFSIINGPEGHQGSEEWREFRKTRVMASDAPIIMGVSPWRTPLELYNEKINGIERSSNKAMEYGKQMEGEIRDQVNKKLGPPDFSPYVVESEDYPGIGASLDGARFRDLVPEALEIKCANEKDHLFALSGIVPDHYIPQLQHIMMVLGSDFCWYVSYFQGEIVYVMVKEDAKYQKELLHEEKAFLGRLTEKRPPEPN